MHQPTVVILGGGYAGLMAASRLARQKVARVLLIDGNATFIQRIRLHQILAGDTVPEGPLARWLAPAGVEFRQTQVTGIQREQRRLLTRDGTLHYDYLIVTSGSQIDLEHIPGAAIHGHSLQSPAQCAALGNRLRQLAPGSRVVLVGAGLTQLETAAELAERMPDLRLTLACRGTAFDSFNAGAQRYLRTHLQQAGVELLEHYPIESLEPGRCLGPRGDLPFELCLSAPGFTASAIATSLDGTLDAQGRIPVSSTLQLPGDDRIWVAGDSAAPPWPGPVALRMGCAVAIPMGTQAGENVAAAIRGATPQDFRFAFLIRCLSLGRKAGLIQTTRWDDSPSTRLFTGRQGAWIKERVCRMTYHVPRWELRTGLRLYRWLPAPATAVHHDPIIQSTIQAENEAG